MKEIKTIAESTAREFDEAVNAAIAEGWTLTKRCPLIAQTSRSVLLYAELEREEITDAEKFCENCKYCDVQPESIPCRNCHDASHWEPEQ